MLIEKGHPVSNRNTTMKSNGLAATAVTDDDEARLQFIALNRTKRNVTKTVGKINGTQASERVSGQTDAITINVENQNKNKCDAVVVVIRLFRVVQRH